MTFERKWQENTSFIQNTYMSLALTIEILERKYSMTI
jgi:hypothetical protein